jgi:hypothetical protein
MDGTEPLLLLAANAGATSRIYLSPVATDFIYTGYGGYSGTGSVGTMHLHPVISVHSAVYDTATSPYLYLYFNAPADGGDMDLTTSANNTIAITVGTCFRFSLVWDVVDTTGVLLYRYFFGCTNSFVRMAADQCYTSVLGYTNAADSFDFHYSGPDVIATNYIELPFYLRDPSLPTDQKIYTRSDGSNVVLYQRKDEQYTLETDLLPYTWHRALDVALAHDTVYITSGTSGSFDPLHTATPFVRKENYEIEYMKAPLSAFGKGTCTLLNADPVHLINNNCG